MEPQAITSLFITAIAVIALFRYRDALAEAIRRGPWNGGGAPPTGPAPAADPFATVQSRIRRRPDAFHQPR